MSLFQSLNRLETNIYTLTAKHSVVKEENYIFFLKKILPYDDSAPKMCACEEKNYFKKKLTYKHNKNIKNIF